MRSWVRTPSPISSLGPGTLGRAARSDDSAVVDDHIFGPTKNFQNVLHLAERGKKIESNPIDCSRGQLPTITPVHTLEEDDCLQRPGNMFLTDPETHLPFQNGVILETVAELRTDESNEPGEVNPEEKQGERTEDLVDPHVSH